MKVQDFKNGDGFITEGISFVRLCDCLANHPAITFAHRRRFFWSYADIRAEFIFHGQTFKIEPWDLNNSLFVSPKDGRIASTAVAELRGYVAHFVPRASFYNSQPVLGLALILLFGAIILLFASRPVVAFHQSYRWLPNGIDVASPGLLHFYGFAGLVASAFLFRLYFRIRKRRRFEIERRSRRP